MTALSAIWLLLIAGISLYPMRALRKRQHTTWWDNVYPFTGIVAWFSLGLANIGSTASLSNFVIEVFWVAVLSVVIPWVRWLLPRAERKSMVALSFLLTSLPIIAAVVIRITMPTLPE